MNRSNLNSNRPSTMRAIGVHPGGGSPENLDAKWCNLVHSRLHTNSLLKVIFYCVF